MYIQRVAPRQWSGHADSQQQLSDPRQWPPQEPPPMQAAVYEPGARAAVCEQPGVRPAVYEREGRRPSYGVRQGGYDAERERERDQQIEQCRVCGLVGPNVGRHLAASHVKCRPCNRWHVDRNAFDQHHEPCFACQWMLCPSQLEQHALEHHPGLPIPPELAERFSRTNRKTQRRPPS
jgi:hypothetical protein